MPAKNAVKYAVTGSEGVSAKRFEMMQEGHVLREPMYCSTACSRYMAATTASASVAGSVLCVYRCVKLAFKYVAAVCGVRVGQPVHELASE